MGICNDSAERLLLLLLHCSHHKKLSTSSPLIMGAAPGVNSEIAIFNRLLIYYMLFSKGLKGCIHRHVHIGFREQS